MNATTADAPATLPDPKTPIVARLELDGRTAVVHALSFGLARKIARMDRDKTDGYDIAALAIGALVRWEDGSRLDLDELSTAAVQKAVDEALKDRAATPDFTTASTPSG